MPHITIILDFDGVILESVSVKTEGFRTLFSFAPEHVNEIVQYHIDNGGISRFDKFRYIYHTILKTELTEKKFTELSETFSAIVYNNIIHSPFVPGAYKFLEMYHLKLPLYIVSATPEEELTQIIQERNMSHYFKEVFGAPRKKAECILRILTRSRTPQELVIFIGDAKNDYAAAQTAGIRFIGVVKNDEDNPFDGLDDVEMIVTDLFELMHYIEGINDNPRFISP